jgi:hypothetical protein
VKAVIKTDWKTNSLPIKKITIQLNKTFTSEEIDIIQKGLIPQEMEDKWFIYWEDDTLFFHRSWTGNCMYIVHFLFEKDSYIVISADVNRDPDQYSETDNNRDIEMIFYLIDILLLRKETTLPGNIPADDKDPLREWSQVGRAMLGQHPDDE